jgi:hypothetical protein
LNAFLEHGDKYTPNPVKSRMRAVETRRQRAMQKALVERDILFRQWKKWREQRKQDLLQGAHGTAVTHLIDFLDGMAIEDEAALIAVIKDGPWLQSDSEVRFQVLSLVDNYLINLRDKAHLPPFDDSVPFSDATPTAFENIRALLDGETRKQL